MKIDIRTTAIAALFCAVTAQTALTTAALAAEAPIRVNSGEMRTLAIADLLFNPERPDPDMGTKEEVRSAISDTLTETGYNVVDATRSSGADAADFILVGGVRRVDCRKGETNACRISVIWTLENRVFGATVYKVTTTAKIEGSDSGDEASRNRKLLVKAVESLLSRERFARVLTKESDESRMAMQLTYPRAGFAQCESEPAAMPKGASKALEATVLIESGEGFGSGVVISPDGLILTAAHVVTDKDIHVVFNDKRRVEARLIRINPFKDTALLRIDGDDHPCLRFSTAPASIGDSVFVLGSPASKALSFSLTSGIVSAFREWSNEEYLQTNAGLNPGNSGGPILNEQGEIIAIVSWKLIGEALEGIGFGVPVGAALTSLSLSDRDRSDATLESTPEDEIAARVDFEPFVDKPDKSKGLEPGRKLTGYTPAPGSKGPSKAPFLGMMLGGLGLATIGGVMALYTYLSVKLHSDSDYPELTYSEYKVKKNINLAGLITAGVGAALYAASFLFLIRKDSDEKSARRERRGPALHFAVGATGAELEVTF